MSVDPSVRIHPSRTVDRALMEQVRRLDLPAFGHVLDDGFAAGLQRVAGGPGLVVGRVVTIRVPGTDSRIVHYATALVEPGDFVVIQPAEHRRHACVGGGVAAALAAAGAVGVAVDGPCTDVAELRGSGLAVHCRELSAFTTRTDGGPIVGSVNVPVSVGGVPARPGMIALADENGVLLSDEDTVRRVIPQVEQLLAWERDVMPHVVAGEPLATYILPSTDVAALDAIAARHRVGGR